MSNSEQEGVGEAAFLATVCLTLGIAFLTGWYSGNPIITIGVGLITFPLAFVVFMFLAIVIEWLIRKV
jgi:hypothetical protein